MPTHNVQIYDFDPLGVFSQSIGGTTTYSGPANTSGNVAITDNGAGVDGQHFDGENGGSVPISINVNGGPTESSTAYAEEMWTLRDTVTGKEFQLATFYVESGGYSGYYTLSEIPLEPGRTYETVTYDEDPDVSAGEAAFAYADFAVSDGIVEGTDGNDVIDTNYTGDPGNDVIDDGASPQPSSLNWTDYADERDLRGGVTQDTGGVEVQVTYSDVQTNEEFSAESSGGIDSIYVAAGEPFNPNSAAVLAANGSADDSNVHFNFAAATGSGFADEVENVQFRISDIDGMISGSPGDDGYTNFRDIITITALDANGDPVAITITPGSNLTVSGNTITANTTDYNPSSPEASALIEIAGPVSDIYINYDNGGDTQQWVYISDVHFDSMPDGNLDDSVEAGAGDDLIHAGEGNDWVHGEEGNDTIYGDAGSDTLEGEAGDDTIYVGSGDVATGGDGDDTFLIDGANLTGGSLTLTGGETGESAGDTLDFNGQLQAGSVVITDGDDANGGKSGTATLLDGTTVNFFEIESIICFVQGTAIETPHGPRPVEDLRIGDLVLTRDNGPQPIRWIGSRTVPGQGNLAPIEFAPGAIGNAEVLRVSPQHRMLIDDYRAMLYFGEEEVIAAAQFLVNGDSIIQRPQAEVGYYHLLFDTHEIILSSGAWSESYHPGDYSLSGLDAAARDELFSVFPDLRSNPNGYGRAARASLKRRAAEFLAA